MTLPRKATDSTKTIDFHKPQSPGVWILSYQRTGSYFLSSILNAAGFSPPLDEHYHPNRATYTGDVPLNNKVHPRQFELQDSVTLKRVVSEYPRTRFLLLRREDLIACAVSVYIARKTGVWEVRRDESFRRQLDYPPIAFDKRHVLATYRRILFDDRYWYQQLCANDLPHLTVRSEDLIKHTAQPVRSVFKYLSITADPETCIAQVDIQPSATRAESREFCAQLHRLLRWRKHITPWRYQQLPRPQETS